MIDDDQARAELDQHGADVLAGKICAQAGIQARATCRLLELIGEFDAGGALGFMRGAKSVAHWVSYTCSLASGTAREYVRVARALRRMPTLAAAFGAGELSYSKVREATRLVGVVEEERLCRLALAESASQFARTLSAFRAAAGTRLPQEERRRLNVVVRDDDSVGMSARLPAEDGGVVAAALRKARDLNAEPPENPTPGGEDPDASRGTPGFSDADALLAICDHYLATAEGSDDSGEDRHLVVVEVAAEQLAAGTPADADAADVPAGTSGTQAAVSEAESVPAGMPKPDPTESAPLTVPAGTSGTERCEPVTQGVPAGTPATKEAATVTGGVPAGTSELQKSESVAGPFGEGTLESEPASIDSGWVRGQVCRVRGIGRVEPATAQRLACTGALLGAIVDAHGDVLALGRTRRLVSKTQRRALMIRDESCRFPGCTRRTHLEAHHRVSWAAGGSTDLDNLILLCRFHHVAVHEGGITITSTGAGGWEFLMPDGEPVATTGWRVPTPHRLIRDLIEADTGGGVDHVDDYSHPDAIRIRPQQYGERFSLHDSVQAVFGMVMPEDQQAA